MCDKTAYRKDCADKGNGVSLSALDYASRQGMSLEEVEKEKKGKLGINIPDAELRYDDFTKHLSKEDRARANIKSDGSLIGDCVGSVCNHKNGRSVLYMVCSHNLGNIIYRIIRQFPQFEYTHFQCYAF